MLVHEAARACHFNGLPERALPLCRQALEMAQRQANIEVQADSLTTLGILSNVSVEEAIDALHRAIALAEEAGLLAIAARAHLNTGSMTRFLPGDQEASRPHFQRSAELSRRRGAVQEEFMAMIGLASVSLQIGDLEEVERTLKQLENYPRRLPDSAAKQVEVDLFRAVLYSMRGEMDMALPLLRQQAEQARQSGDLQSMSNTLNTMIDIFLEMYRQGDLADTTELEGYLEETLSLAQRGHGSPSSVYANLAALRSLQHRFDEAHAAIQAGRQSTEPRYAMRDLLLEIAEIELAACEGNLDKALKGFEGLQLRSRQTSRWHWARLTPLGLKCCSSAANLPTSSTPRNCC